MQLDSRFDSGTADCSWSQQVKAPSLQVGIGRGGTCREHPLGKQKQVKLPYYFGG